MAEEFNIKKEYGNIKYSLPDFEELDNEFEISNLQDIDRKFLVRAIRRRVIEKIVFFNGILESILHPNPQSIVSMHENKSFSEEEKMKVIKILRKLMKMERENLKFDINPNIDLECKFINKIFKEIKEIKNNIQEFTSIMEDAWSKEEEKIVSESYFG